jgi:hypothetical protein
MGCAIKPIFGAPAGIRLKPRASEQRRGTSELPRSTGIDDPKAKMTAKPTLKTHDCPATITAMMALRRSRARVDRASWRLALPPASPRLAAAHATADQQSPKGRSQLHGTDSRLHL